MEHQEIHLARGAAAQELLANQTFAGVTNELVNSYLQSIVQSNPEEAAARERLYVGVKAVQDIVGTLNQWVAVAAQVRLAQEEQETQDTDAE